MLDFGAPAWLLAAPPVWAIVWWLHRLRSMGTPVRVAALFLWRASRERAAAGAALAPRADPIWWLRAGVATLLIVALAEPSLPSRAARIEVWFDDSLSMLANDGEGSRQELAVDALLDALGSVESDDVRLRSLGEPGASLELRGPVAQRAATVTAWLGERTPKEPVWPAPIELDGEAEHWVVTDGADSGTAAWLASVPVTRVIRVGDAVGNAAVTRVSARTSLDDTTAWSGFVEVGNYGNAETTRTLSLDVGNGDRELGKWTLMLAPGESTQRDFSLPASGDGERLTARLDSSDALAADDALDLELGPTRLPARIDGACGPNLAAVLRAHPRLAPAASSPAVRVDCGELTGRGAVPTLRVHAGEPLVTEDAGLPVWTQAAQRFDRLVLEPSALVALDVPVPEGEPWLYVGAQPAIVFATEPAPTLHVLLDLENETLARSPEYPVLVARLLAAVHPDTALDRVATVTRDPVASDVVPRQLPAIDGAETGRSAGRTIALQTSVLTAALVLLLLDATLLLKRGTSDGALRLIAMRGLLAAALVAALLRPAALLVDSPRDLIVLWDDSASMSASVLDVAWDRIARVAAALPAGSRATVLRFAAGTAVEAQRSEEALAGLASGARPTAALALDTGGTDLAAALRTGLRFVDPARPTTVALLSDGHVASADATEWLDRARLSRLPIHSLGAPATVPVTMRVDTPQRSAAGRELPVDVMLEARTDMRGSLTLVLDGEVLAETEMELSEGRPVLVRFELEPAAGARALVIHWASADGVLTRELGLDVEGATPWLLLTHSPDGPAARALRAGGWRVESATPANFGAYADRAGTLAGIVLDDLAIGDLPDSDWTALTAAVTQSGSTLLVLGGPRSFGAGGYRRSELESILPVTAEARDPRARSAVLFVLDVSGSMGRSLTATDPLGYARRAVIETARTLDADDEVGLIAFDVEARNVLPLARYDDPAEALGGTFATLGAAGGTRLRPALQAAIEALDSTSLTRRMLVLVTDGFLETEALGSSLQALQARGVELVALAIGRDADRLALRDLAGADNVFRVERVSELPELMRAEVERRRQPMHEGLANVRLVTPIPGLEMADAPAAVTGFMRTRARPGAAVYLESASGDPLLAAQSAGAGRVAVLPAGLGDWASGWTEDALWPVLAGALGNWLADRDAAARLQLRVAEDDAGWVLDVDAIDADGAWSETERLDATIADPLADIRRVTLARTAPGRYSARVPVRVPGRHQLGVEYDAHRLSRVEFRSDRHELESVQAPSRLPEWIERGLLAPAPDSTADWRFSESHGEAALRPLVLVAALAGLLLTLAYPHRAALAALARAGYANLGRADPRRDRSRS